MCWQASISVNWAVGGVCKVFACLLGSWRASFGTELLIAALTQALISFITVQLYNLVYSSKKQIALSLIYEYKCRGT